MKKSEIFIPKKPLRSETVILKVTPEEKQKLITLATEHAEGSVSSYVRTKSLEDK